MKDIPAILLLYIFLFAACDNGRKNSEKGLNGLEQIIDKDTIKVCTLWGENSFYVNKDGDTTGFQYTKVNNFAKHLGVHPDIHALSDEKKMLDELRKGKYDLAAYNIPRFESGQYIYIWCGDPISTTQVLVQRKGTSMLKNVNDLRGKTVYVLREKHKIRMENLNEEIGGGINIVKFKAGEMSLEEAFEAVATGKIDFFVFDNDISEINCSYYQNLDYSLTVSFEQYNYWVVPARHKELAAAIDEWSKSYTGESYEEYLEKYYDTKLRECIKPAIKDRKNAVISDYDDLFRKYAVQIGWDWKLLAALAYAESKFCHTLSSPAGAMGLMQLMPATLKAYGVDEKHFIDPEENIKAATLYIKRLQQIYSRIKDKDEKKLFILAAYNAGQGHLTDAMQLAEKHGKNKYIWNDNVELFFTSEYINRYYDDPICRYGRFKGQETLSFISTVMKFHKIYLNISAKNISNEKI